MPKFRKKPVVVDATQFNILEAWPAGVWRANNGRPYVITIHQDIAYLADGDWILSEPKPGRFYPCKPDIFAATYEPVD